MIKLLNVLLIVVVGVAGLLMLPTLIDGVKQAGGEVLPSSAVAMLDVMPVVFAVCFIVAAFFVFTSIEVAHRYYKWSAYGSRLKEAYSAKFGGANPAFSTEVDMHISAVRALGGSSVTKEANVEWLKRMAEFVEVPWAIPEEERLTEVEKTEQYE